MRSVTAGNAVLKRADAMFDGLGQSRSRPCRGRPEPRMTPRRSTVAAVTCSAVSWRTPAGATAGAHRGELLDALAGDLRVICQAKADTPALAVDLDHANIDLIALVEHILYRVHALTGRHIGDVKQAVGALGELHESPEGSRLDDLARELVADLDLLHHRADVLDQRVAEDRRWPSRSSTWPSSLTSI